MTIQRTMTFFGKDESSNGMLDPWFHYLIFTSPGHKPDSGIASILSLSEARATAMAQGASYTILSPSGGADGAMNAAEQFLDSQHQGLKKIVSDAR